MASRSEGRSRAALALRRSVLRRGALALAAAVALTGAAPAPARAADTEPIRIVFHAPAGCPDEAAFTGQVLARTARARLAGAGEAARTFTVTVTAQGARIRGKLTIDDPGGPPAARDVMGGTCDEVVSAIGLVAALAIDPHASTAPTPPPPTPPPPPAPPPAPREPLPPPRRYDALHDALPWWGPIGAPLPVIPGPEPEPEPRWRFGGGVHVGAASGVAPSLLVMGGVHAEIARYGGGVLSPAFRLGYAGGDSGDVDLGGGHTGRFALHVARAEGCPVRLALVSTLAAFPCVLFDAGALLASGHAPGTSLSGAHPWAAPGAVARIQWEILGWLRFEAEGGVNVRLVQYTFSFADPLGVLHPVHQVAPAGGFFAGGVGAHFP